MNVASKRTTPKGKPAKPTQQKVETLVSIPADMVLAPQAEAPRQLTGRDQSQKKSNVLELSWADFDQQVQNLARALSSKFTPDMVVGVAHGGLFAGAALSGALGCDFYPVRISRRSRDTGTRRRPMINGEMPVELKDCRVLIVDDVAASGDTLALATALALKVGAKEVKTSCLVSRQEGFTPDFFALTTEQLVIFPWDYDAVAEDGRFDVDPDKAGA